MMASATIIAGINRKWKREPIKKTMNSTVRIFNVKRPTFHRSHNKKNAIKIPII
jgi:hypothetical protein